MPISLKAELAGSGGGVPIGGVAMLASGSELPLASFSGMEFLRSGYLLSGEAANYPEAFQAFGVPGRTWTRSAQQFGDSTSSMVRVLRNGGLYIAVGRSTHYGLQWFTGIIYTSTDGKAWTSRYRGPGNGESVDYDLTCIASGAGLYVALGAGGYLVTSPDGLAWTARPAISGASRMRSVTFGNGQFLALDQSGRIYKSVDGITGWTLLSTNTALREISFLGGKFFAVGAAGYLASSADGAAWTVHASGSSGELTRIYLHNGLYIALGTGAATSADGVTWAKCEIGITGGALAYLAGWYLVIGAGVSASRDGEKWIPFASTSGLIAPSDIVATDSDFVVMGTDNSGAANHLKTSYCSVADLSIGMATAYSQGEATQYMRIK